MTREEGWAKLHELYKETGDLREARRLFDWELARAAMMKMGFDWLTVWSIRDWVDSLSFEEPPRLGDRSGSDIWVTSKGMYKWLRDQRYSLENRYEDLRRVG